MWEGRELDHGIPWSERGRVGELGAAHRLHACLPPGTGHVLRALRHFGGPSRGPLCLRGPGRRRDVREASRNLNERGTCDVARCHRLAVRLHAEAEGVRHGPLRCLLVGWRSADFAGAQAGRRIVAPLGSEALHDYALVNEPLCAVVLCRSVVRHLDLTHQQLRTRRSSRDGGACGRRVRICRRSGGALRVGGRQRSGKVTAGFCIAAALRLDFLVLINHLDLVLFKFVFLSILQPAA
mmetsp:Transcript_143164/g.457640  ORF Transcript_143164/g.457640 Transcript_143164/m.457640 type:complete len:238 (+) Transcript_143164:702-1415(+)